MKKVSTLIAGIVVLGVVVVTTWGYQKYFKAEVISQLEFTVERQNLEEVVNVRGQVVSEQDYDLQFPLSGTVEKVYVEEGDTVKEGDLLMELDTTDFRLERSQLYAQRQQAVAAVEAAQAQKLQLVSALEREQARLDELRRGTRPEEIDIAYTNVENAKIRLNDTEIELQNAREKAEQDADAFVQAGRDVLQQVSVTANKVLSQNLQDIVYPIRIPYRQTCILQVTSLAEQQKGLIYDTCLNALSGSEELIRIAQSLPLDTNSNEVMTHLSTARTTLTTIRSLLDLLFNLVNGAIAMTDNSFISSSDLNTLKAAITSGQTDIESAISQVTTATENLQSQMVANKSTLDIAQNAVNQARNTLRSAEAELTLVEADTREEQITAQESAVRQAEANIAVQDAQIKQARAQISGIDAQISAVTDKIQKSTLRAREPLRVIEIWVEEQEVFRAELGARAITLYTTAYKIQADVSELEIGKIRTTDGNNVRIFLDAFPEKSFTGQVTNIEEREIDIDGDKYYRVNVRLDAPEEGINIRSGMSADLGIIISQQEGALTLPDIAIENEDGRAYVNMLDETTGETQQVFIETGVSNGDKVEILSGLEEGQKVVIFGS